MKRFVALVMLSLTLSALNFAQNSTSPRTPSAPAKKSPLADYVGSWVSTFDGHPWLTIRLSVQGTAVSGIVQRAHEFQFADSGMLKSVSDDQITQNIESASLQGDGLLIAAKDPNSQQPDRYLVRLTGANTADLKMVGMSMPPGMSKPQPWKLNRASAVAPSHP